MMMASLMAGLAFSNASLGLVHAMAHSLGGLLGLPHGECNAILLEEVIRYNYPCAGDKYDRMAKAMGLEIHNAEPSRKAGLLVEQVAILRKQLSIHQRLGDMGVALSDIPRLAVHACDDPCLATNPRGAATSDIEKIFASIY